MVSVKFRVRPSLALGLGTFLGLEFESEKRLVLRVVTRFGLGTGLRLVLGRVRVRI